MLREWGKFTNQHELQTKSKAVIDRLKRDKKLIILRYTTPVGMLLSMKEYFKLLGRKDCKACQKAIKNIEHKIGTLKTKSNNNKQK